MLKNISTLSLFILAIILSAWSIFMTNRSHSHFSLNNAVDQPDAFMEEVTSVIFNNRGKLALTLSSPKMFHYADNDSMTIVKPHVTFFRTASEEKWTINSDSAKTSQGITQILFSGNVVIHHPQDKNDSATTMQTATLTIFPDKNRAETDQAVTITQPDTLIHAVGMLANLNTGTIKLLSQARGEYVPNS